MVSGPRNTVGGYSFLLAIFKKVYAFGMPGICFARSFYEHAITVNEFIIIYNIYEKYRGLPLLEMSR